MASLARYLGLFTVVVAGLTQVDIRPVHAYPDDPRLQRRIAELESENRALRKILQDIQQTLDLVPQRKLVPQAGRDDSLRIIVFSDDWGGSQLEDIRKVCLSSASALWSEMDNDGLAPILVRRSRTGPITLFRRGNGHEFIVKLDTGGNAWAQCAFQFSHEFCHIVCNYRDVPNQQLWFEETLCECASLYALRRMSKVWKTKPPYPNWAAYSHALKDYADQRMQKYQDQTKSIAEYYRSHRLDLEKSATQRELNGYIATKLLPYFEKSPASWQALRYLNLGPATENQSFTKYLSAWRERVPGRHRAFVDSIAAEFEIDLTPTDR